MSPPFGRRGPFESSPSRPDRTELVIVHRRGSEGAPSSVRGRERAVDARRCFVRALQARHRAEGRRLVDDETARLGLLEQRLHERHRAEPEKVVRRLRGVGKLRRAIRP